jgi:hypothetical protein
LEGLDYGAHEEEKHHSHHAIHIGMHNAV